MGNLGWSEIMIILVLALIVFGPRKLPELGKSLGAGLAQFRKASEDFKRTWEDEVESEKHRIGPAPPDPDPPADDFAIAGSEVEASPEVSPETSDDPEPVILEEPLEDPLTVGRTDGVRTTMGEGEKRDSV